MIKHKDFTDFLNDKFYADHPTTLDDEWPDLYSDWLSDQDCDTMVKYADEYAEALKKRVEELQHSEKALSDTYLRIRGLLGAWDTSWGGENRFEVTEARIRAIKKREAIMCMALKDILSWGTKERPYVPSESNKTVQHMQAIAKVALNEKGEV